MVSPLVHFRKNKNSSGAGSGDVIESLFTNSDDENSNHHRHSTTNTTASSKKQSPIAAASATTDVAGSSIETIQRVRHGTTKNLTTPTTYGTEKTANRNNNDNNDDYSSSSSSSDDDDDILSDTEYTADYIRRKYTQIPTRRNITLVGELDDNDNEDVIQLMQSNNSNTTTTMITKKGNNDPSNEDSAVTTTSQSMTKWKKITQRIELKLYHQFHYRNQIYNHLVSLQQQQQQQPIHQNNNRIRKYFHNNNANTIDYLQSIFDRECQVRYCTVDRVIYKLQQRLQNQNNSTNRKNRCSSDNNIIPLQQQQQQQQSDKMEDLRQRLYQMVEKMHQSNKFDKMSKSCNGHHSTDHHIKQETKTLDLNEVAQQDQLHSLSLLDVFRRMVNVFVIMDNDDMLFIKHLFLPAIASLLVHCMIHTSLYDGTIAVLEILKSYMTTASIQLLLFLNDRNRATPISKQHQGDDDSSLLFMDYIWTTMVFTFGAILLRSTGDIYWWSSESNYELIKFDFRNRRQLLQSRQQSVSGNASTGGQDDYQNKIESHESSISCKCKMTQITMWVRQREIVRAILFMVGYTCCYIASGEYLQYATQFVHYCYNIIMTQHWNHHILFNLPSIVEMTLNGTCLSDDHIVFNTSFCSSTCQNELEHRGMY